MTSPLLQRKINGGSQYARFNRRHNEAAAGERERGTFRERGGGSLREREGLWKTENPLIQERGRDREMKGLVGLGPCVWREMFFGLGRGETSDPQSLRGAWEHAPIGMEMGGE